jgi:acyl-coenzyme A synthetase/AMP-(fatty) acid ligase
MSRFQYVNIEDGNDLGCELGRVTRMYFISLPRKESNKPMRKVLKKYFKKITEKK